MEKEIKKTETQALETQVDTLLDSRKYFIDKVLPILAENQDYYTIMNKKSLAKGGAEKLLTIFGFVADFQVDKETMELIKQDGLIAYVCNLKNKNGDFTGQGRGADTLGRNKNDANKTIKMAQKRAFVDAVIRTTGLSDIFTQDLEDMNLKEEKKQYQKKQNYKQNYEQKYSQEIIQKNTIMKLSKSLNSSLKTKGDYETFIQDETGLTLENKNYADIIKMLNILTKALEKKSEEEKNTKELAKALNAEIIEEMSEESNRMKMMKNGYVQKQVIEDEKTKRGGSN